MHGNIYHWTAAALRTRRGDQEFRIGVFNSLQTPCDFYRHHCGAVTHPVSIQRCVYPTLRDDYQVHCTLWRNATYPSKHTMCLYVVQCRLNLALPDSHEGGKSGYALTAFKQTLLK